MTSRNVSFSYPSGRRALSAVDLEVRRDGVTGLLGPNGSGKSTLIRLLATSLDPTTGEIVWFDGWRRSRERLNAIRRRIAPVFDRAPFAESLSGRANALRHLALCGVADAAARERLDRCLERFELGERAREPVSEYSRGMRRKLALAEAVAARTDVLLLDEPLVGLDARARAALADVLSERTGGGAAVLVASHDASFLQRVCHRVFLLHRGRIVARGEPERLVGRLGGTTLIVVEVDGGIELQGGVERAGAVEREVLGSGTDEYAAVPGDAAATEDAGDDGRAGPDLALPEGVELVAHGEGTLRFSSGRGTAPLPALCRELLSAGLDVRTVEVREPGLHDVFLRVTGTALEAGRGSGEPAPRGGTGGPDREAARSVP